MGTWTWQPSPRTCALWGRKAEGPLAAGEEVPGKRGAQGTGAGVVGEPFCGERVLDQEPYISEGLYNPVSKGGPLFLSSSVI